MMHTVTTFISLAVIVEAKMPLFQSRWQAQHHDALTGRGRPIADLHINGHQDKFVIKPQIQHSDALTGQGPSLSDQFIKGNVRDNFSIGPQDRHHDALTGLGPQFPDQFIKGHVLDPDPSFKDGSLKTPAVANNVKSMREDVPFCKISGDHCSQYTLQENQMFATEWFLQYNPTLAMNLGGFKTGTCWEHGYNVNEGSKEISMPWIGKTHVRIFKESHDAIPHTQVFSQTSPDFTSVFAVALMSLAGVSGAIFAMRRGTFMARNMKESLLVTSRV